MNAIKSFLTRLFFILFTFLFIYPAILFACLVLGFTTSWKSGAVMLALALLTLIIMKREAAQLPPMRRTPNDRHPSGYDCEESPPHLSDIYYDIAAALREQELLNSLDQQCDKPKQTQTRKK